MRKWKAANWTELTVRLCCVAMTIPIQSPFWTASFIGQIGEPGLCLGKSFFRKVLIVLL